MVAAIPKEPELQRKHNLLKRLTEEGGEMEENLDYELTTAEGRRFYESFTDEALLDLLQAAARRLGHSPTQREVLPALRCYLRQRFGTWPCVLQKAGLSKSAGRGGESIQAQAVRGDEAEMLLQSVREQARALGRTPHPGDLPQVCAALRRQYKTWGEVLTAAGLERIREETVCRIENLEPEYLDMLEALRSIAAALGRAPQRREVDEHLRTSLTTRCGSWRNALFQIGLEPVQRISPFSTAYLDRPNDTPRRQHRGTLHDCYYRMLNLDQESQAQLEGLKAQALRLGRPPDRREVPADVRRHLQDVCGSWANALFQVGLHTAATQAEPGLMAQKYIGRNHK